MLTLPISYLTMLPLKHHGDCSLLGVTPEQAIYAEEVYGENGSVAQHELRFDGSFVRSVDEGGDASSVIQPLDLPERILKPKSCWQTMGLNFAGPRHRGMRAPERLLDMVRPLAIQEKIAVLQKLKLDVLPPLLLGIADSYVLSESQIVRPNLYFVCRRIRLAFALPEPHLDEDHQPYDYDTQVLYVAHFYDCAREPPFAELLADLTSVPLKRPMDCLLVNDLLYIADGGDEDRLSAIHVWQLALPAVLSEEEKLQKKIYG